MKKNESKLDVLVDHGNRKLKSLARDFEAVRLEAEEYDGEITVMSGGSVLSTGDFHTVKEAVWQLVDSIREQAEAAEGISQQAVPPASAGIRKAHREHREKKEWLSDFEFLMKKIGEQIAKANERMAEIVKDGYPFAMADVQMSLTSDSAGVYVRSGKTPVKSVARTGDIGSKFADIKSAIWETVDSTRTAVERRTAQRKEADDMSAEDEKLRRAYELLSSAGEDTSVLGGVPPEVALAITEAAENAVKSANSGTFMNYTRACEALYGGYHSSKFELRGYYGGIVVKVDGKACLVTRFPKVANSATLEKTISFVENDIRSIAESRRQYLAKVEAEIEREEAIHSIAEKMDELTAQLMSM